MTRRFPGRPITAQRFSAGGAALAMAWMLIACEPSSAPSQGGPAAATSGRQASLAAGLNERSVRHHLARSQGAADTVEVYSDPGFGGTMERFGPGVFAYNDSAPEIDGFASLRNDDASSLNVGSAATAWLCADFGLPADNGMRSLGHCRVFTAGSVSSLVPQGFDDKASTVIINSGPSLRPAPGLIAWSDNGFSGARQVFQVGGFDYSDLVNGVGNDAISSLEVLPGYLGVVCTNGIVHAQSLTPAGVATGAECRLFPAGGYPSLPADMSDLITYINVLPVSTNPALVGSFSSVKEWPFAPIHQYLLADGRVMANESTPDDGNPSTPEYMIWDPATDTTTTGTAFAPGTDLFCSAHVHLPSGDLLAVAAGGGGNTVNTVLRYDSATGRWEQAPSMIWKRYYPSAALTTQGSVLVVGGNDVFGLAYSQGTMAIETPEIFERWNWRELPGAKVPFSNNRGATNDSSYWPWLQTAPNGRVFMAGPDLGMRYIDTQGGGSLSELGARDTTFRSYGSYATFAPGRMLVAGGGNSVSTASVIAFDGNTASVSTVSPMLYGRRQLNLTLLANGEVLASGGNSDGQETFSSTAAVLTTEIWNPATQSWRVGADHVRSRQYHSTALLIPDGRVVVAGQCSGPPCERNAELYSPPYLFAADGTPASRPKIVNTLDQWRYATRLTIDYQGDSISQAHLIKLGAVTHATNFTQRRIPLNITSSSTGQLMVDAPLDANAAPPGHYMLILVDSNGVPSVARIIQVTGNIAPLASVSQTSTYGGNQFPASLAVDGKLDNFAHTATPDHAATFTLSFSEDRRFDQVVIHNRPGYAHRTRDIVVTVYNSAGSVVYTTPVINPGNVLQSPKHLEVDFHRIGVGAITGRRIVIGRMADASLSGGPGDNADGIGTLNLAEIQVFASE